MSGLIKKNILGALFLLLLPFFAHAQQADISTQNLPSGGQLQTGDQIVVTRGNNTLNAGWPPLSLPPPTTATLGGLYALGAPTANQWVSYVDALGVQHLVQPYFANIGGTVAGAQLPTPTLSALGGVFSLTPPSHEFLSGLYDNGTFAAAQPAFSDISGVATASQIPYPTSGTIGGIESFAAQSNQFLTGVTTGGVPTAAQPAFTNLTGNIAVSQMNGGSGASSSTYWRGDGTWAANGLPSLGSNQFIGSLTTGIPSGQSVPSCSGSQEALIYTAGTGFGCTTVGGSGSPTGTAGGDLGGNYPNPTVAGVGDVTTGVLPQANGGTGVNTIYNARGVPSNQWTGLYVFGDADSYNESNIPLSNGWGQLLANQMGTGPTYQTYNAFGLFGCDMVNLKMWPLTNQQTNNNLAAAFLPLTSDPTWGGSGHSGFSQHLADNLTCFTGGLTWMTTPTQYKTYAQALSGVTTSGTWTADADGIGYTSNTNTSTLTFTATSNGGPFVLWASMIGDNGGAYTWTLDNTTTGSIATEGQNSFTYPLSSTSTTLGGYIIPPSGVLAAGAHTVEVAVSSTTTTSNTVDIKGIGTPPGQAYSQKSPSIVLGGQVYKDATYQTQAATLNTAYQGLALSLLNDGWGVLFANIPLYFNFNTDLTNYSGNINLNNLAQTHIASAFTGILEPIRNSKGYIDPRDYGASANSIYFPGNYCTTCFPVTTTQGSPVISIGGYSFQPGVATQFGGGDVGKKIAIFGGDDGDVGPSTYILSVSTTSGGSSATLGANMQASLTGGNGRNTKMGGYPTNPNNPATAADDTVYTEEAGQAAILGGGIVFIPTNLFVANLVMPENITVEGNGPGQFYQQQGWDTNLTPAQATIVNCDMTFYPDDVQQCIQTVPHVLYKDFMINAGTFPYTPYGLSGACLGYSTSGGGPGSQVLTENISTMFCPVKIGQAYGFNHTVSFLATVTPNGDGATSTMNVLSIPSTTFNAADNWSSSDFLALERTITAAGGVLGSGTVTITAAAQAGGTGNYTINKSLTVSTPTAMTAPENGLGIELRDWNSQSYADAIAYNGDFTDSVIYGSTCTGTFANGCWRLGPSVAGFGNSGNRWIGGRMEEMGVAAITCDGCEIEITGLDNDFNQGYNIRTLGSGSVVQYTGGGMDAGGHCSGYQDCQVMLGGTNPSVDINGVRLGTHDYGSGCGGSTTYLFCTATGSSGVIASVEGGNTIPSGNTITNLYQWLNGAPSKYKQDTAGWPTIDTTLALTATSTGFSIGSLSGGALYATTSAGSTGATGVITLTLPAVGTNWNCSGGDQTAPSAFVLGPTTSTSCALNATSTVTSGDVIWLSAPNGK